MPPCLTLRGPANEFARCFPVYQLFPTYGECPIIAAATKPPYAAATFARAWCRREYNVIRIGFLPRVDTGHSSLQARPIADEHLRE